MLSGNEVAALGLGHGGSGDLPVCGRGEALFGGDDSDQLLAAGESRRR